VRPLLSRRGAVTALQQACELGSFPVGFSGSGDAGRAALLAPLVPVFAMAV